MENGKWKMENMENMENGKYGKWKIWKMEACAISVIITFLTATLNKCGTGRSEKNEREYCMDFTVVDAPYLVPKALLPPIDMRHATCDDPARHFYSWSILTLEEDFARFKLFSKKKSKIEELN